MSNDLDKDTEWLQRLVAAMNEISSPCSGASALDSQTHSLYQRLKLPAGVSLALPPHATRRPNEKGDGHQ